MTRDDKNELRQMMLNLARSIRASSRGNRDGFYDDDIAKAQKAAVRDALDEVAGSIDATFGFDSGYQTTSVDSDNPRDEDTETP